MRNRHDRGDRLSPFLLLAGLWILLTSPVSGSTELAFRQHDIQYQSGDLLIAGTLTLPLGEGPFPGIVMVDGSGPTTRENMDDFVYAFANAGIASLAYDKRGLGRSDGDSSAWQFFSISGLATDAAAGLDEISKHPQINAHQIGVLGISQGGWVAPLAAQISGRANFMILISASVTTIAQDRLFERAARLRNEGFGDQDLIEVRQMQIADQQLTRSGSGFEGFSLLWQENQEKSWFRRVYMDDAPAGPKSRWRLWYRGVLDFDPVPILQQLDIPTLWIFGDPSHDPLAPVAQSLVALQALQEQGKDYSIHSFPGTDHNVMPVENPEVDMPPYVGVLGEWLEAQFAKGKGPLSLEDNP